MITIVEYAGILLVGWVVLRVILTMWYELLQKLRR